MRANESNERAVGSSASLCFAHPAMLYHRVALLLALVASATAYTPATVRPPLAMRSSSISMVDQFRWSSAKAGGKAVITEAPSEIQWAKAAWESLGKDATATVTEECYMVSDMAPDSSSEWFFCSAPSDDPNMTCQEMPTWMGKMPDGSAVYICSTPKVA